jgi:hypothetical protein
VNGLRRRVLGRRTFNSHVSAGLSDWALFLDVDAAPVSSATLGPTEISPVRDGTICSLARQCREKGSKKVGVLAGDDTKRKRTPVSAIPEVDQ